MKKKSFVCALKKEKEEKAKEKGKEEKKEELPEKKEEHQAEGKEKIREEEEMTCKSLKWRPLVSYREHRWRKLLSLVSRY